MGAIKNIRFTLAEKAFSIQPFPQTHHGQQRLQFEAPRTFEEVILHQGATARFIH